MKFKPTIVAVVPPSVGELALFGSQLAERTGASNVMTERDVPMSVVTVTVVRSPTDMLMADEDAVTHLSADAVTQDTDAQLTELTPPVGVKSATPKLKPERVVKEEPDAGMFPTNALVTEGASNEIEFRLVPTNAAMVRTAVYFGTLPALDMHRTDVDVDHEVVAHAVPPRPVEGV